MANNLDLGQIYGLSNCPMGGCDSMHMNNPNIPSLEEIANNNMPAAALRTSVSSDNTNTSRDVTRTASVASAPPNSIPITQMSAFPNAQPAANGVSNANQIPMTQEQINAENPSTLMPIENYNQPFPVTAESIQYLNSLMRTQIGRRVTVEFLIGSGSLISKSGYLLAVGANFILLNEIGTNDVLSCDFYAIKFVTFYY